MKRLFICLLPVIIASASANAQLTNSKWQGVLKLDNDVNVTFDFAKDTLTVFNLDEKIIIETMTYTSTNSMFTLTKVSGQSDCDNATRGKYKYEIKDNILSMTLVEDACDDRSSVLKNLQLNRCTM